MDALSLTLPAVPVRAAHHHLVRRVLIGGGLGLLVALAITLVPPTPKLGGLDARGQQPLNAPITVHFSWPVARTLDVRLSPAVDGAVSYTDALVQNRLMRTVVFTPQNTWQAGQTYTLSLSGIRSATGIAREREVSFSFTTAEAPALTSIVPQPTTTLVADGTWVLTFNAPLSEAHAITARTDPPVELRVTPSPDRQSVTLQPVQLLGQGKQYALTVERVSRQFTFGTSDVAIESPPQPLVQESWTVREPPGITAVQPTGTSVDLGAKVTVTFAEPVALDVVEKYATFAPALAGTWRAVGEKTAEFTPSSPLAKATTYTLTLASGMRTASGGFFETDTRVQFRTQEPVALASSAPAPNAKGITVTRPIRLTFNQDVDRDDARRRARIAPAVQGTWAWSGDDLVFTPKSQYAFATTYTVTVQKGVVALRGFPSESDLTVRFTTELPTTRLAVPFHRQQHKLSCEIATLVMALRYRGLNVGEQEIIDAIGFDPTPKKGGVWGDPDQAFVGDIDGQQVGTGYGVHAAPIARVGSTYRPSRDISGASLTAVLQEVQAGNPVIVWGNASTGQRVDWKTPAGKTVRAIIGEHTRVVVGFVGSVSNPTTIVTLDPLFGEKRFSRTAFIADWAILGNLAVVVE